MKRYAIVEVPDSYPGAEYWDTRGNVYVPVLTGPVELMKAACKAAGVEMLYETMPGNYYLTPKGVWWKAIHPVRWNDYRPVIPAIEPEKEKPCPNCHWTAEWQVAEPGGIGCGGTGGPL